MVKVLQSEMNQLHLFVYNQRLIKKIWNAHLEYFASSNCSSQMELPEENIITSNTEELFRSNSAPTVPDSNH
jgi:hypothetical protein